MNVNSPGLATTTRKTTPHRVLDLATGALALAWLAFACYALAYLISH